MGATVQVARFLRMGPFVPAGFLRENRSLLRSRSRVGIVLSAAIVLSFALVDWTRIPEHIGEAVAIRVAGATALLALLPLTWWTRMEPWAELVPILTLAILASVILAMLAFYSGVSDPRYVQQVTGLILVLAGAGLLIPADGPMMFRLAAVPFALHVLLTRDYPLAENFPVLFYTFAAVIIVTVGAHALFLGRLGEYEGRLAKEALDRARADFVGMITHDIKNPLAAIEGLAEILGEDPTLGEEHRETTTRIRACARTALHLAVNFLDTSKIEAGALRLSRKPVDVASFVHHAVTHQRALADLKRVRLVEDIAADVPALDADEAAVDRVVANLVNNAIKYSPPGGTVRIAARCREEMVEISVEDSGEGIPPERLQALFQRYVQASARTDSTGLGLFIARTITEAHGGAIRAENQDDCPGARFRVLLPVVRSAVAR